MADVLNISPVANGYRRQWVKCKQCGRPAYYDYIPRSLSNPIMSLPCGHDMAQRFHSAVIGITEEEALNILNPPPVPPTIEEQLSDATAAIAAVHRSLDDAGIAPADCADVQCVGSVVKRVRVLIADDARLRDRVCGLLTEVERAEATTRESEKTLWTAQFAATVFQGALQIIADEHRTEWESRGFVETLDALLAQLNPGAALLAELEAARAYINFLHTNQGGYLRGIAERDLLLSGQDVEWKRLCDAFSAARAESEATR